MKSSQYFLDDEKVYKLHFCNQQVNCTSNNQTIPMKVNIVTKKKQ